MQNRLTPARFPYVEGCLDHVFQSLRICSINFAVFGSCSTEQPCRNAPRGGKIQPVGGVLEDYELYFDDGTSLTTKEPSGSYEETSLLGIGG